MLRTSRGAAARCSAIILDALPATSFSGFPSALRLDLSLPPLQHLACARTCGCLLAGGGLNLYRVAWRRQET